MWNATGRLDIKDLIVQLRDKRLTLDEIKAEIGHLHGVQLTDNQIKHVLRTETGTAATWQGPQVSSIKKALLCD